ncbi:MAG: lipid-A-disaccharide synthase [candidate division Zixibacteria bacterium]|nr:lipid-A-disaccharide synthase [candidate division Zixibacteria bacterium]
MNESRKILIVAGEASGDLHGSNLIREIKNLNPQIQLFGIGGDRMKKEGMELIHHIDKLSIMGFFEVLSNLRLIREVMKTMLKSAEERKPDLVVLIDYPGFNLRFAKKVKKMGIPIAYYISPQVWAWGGNRVRKMKGLIDKMIVIFPFEKEIYKKFDIDCEFVGHPLLEVVRPVLSREDFQSKFDLRKNEVLLGLLPGSRWQEVERILPIMVKTAEFLESRIRNLRIMLGLASTIKKEKVQIILDQFKSKVDPEHSRRVEIIENLTYDLMKHSDLLLVTSGTATLESAILGTPFLVLYKTSLWTYLFAKSLVSIPNIALANVVAGKKIVPEYIQSKAVPRDIAEETYDILTNKQRYKSIQNELSLVKEKIGSFHSLQVGEVGASKRAAQIINGVISV